jgi:hypothetical protein
MSFERFLAEGRLRPRRTRRDDIHHLLRIAVRDLADAEVAGLSPDRRFLIAYEAALTLATVPLFCAGYETHGAGHHWVTFQLLPHFMGEAISEVATYFESCRTKRNVGTYDRGGEISETEAGELTAEVSDFKTQVENWLRAVHPEYT